MLRTWAREHLNSIPNDSGWPLRRLINEKVHIYSGGGPLDHWTLNLEPSVYPSTNRRFPREHPSLPLFSQVLQSKEMAHTEANGTILLDIKSVGYLAILAACLVVIPTLGRVST